MKRSVLLFLAFTIVTLALSCRNTSSNGDAGPDRDGDDEGRAELDSDIGDDADSEEDSDLESEDEPDAETGDAIILRMTECPSTDADTSWNDQEVILMLRGAMSGRYDVTFEDGCLRLQHATIWIGLFQVPQTISALEVDVRSDCAPGCTGVDGFINGPMVDSVQNSATGVDETLIVEWSDGLDSVHIESENGLVCEIRLRIQGEGL